jgi:polysaccharide export outer membrane protein
MASCIGARKTQINNYLENVADTIGKDSSLLFEPVIQKNDLLSIQVYSASTRPEVDAAYNLPQIASAGGGASTPGGFLVNEKGDIEYPRLGTIHAEGLTKTQLAEVIKQKLEGQLNQPTVLIHPDRLPYQQNVLQSLKH